MNVHKVVPKPEVKAETDKKDDKMLDKDITISLNTSHFETNLYAHYDTAPVAPS